MAAASKGALLNIHYYYEHVRLHLNKSRYRIDRKKWKSCTEQNGYQDSVVSSV